LIWRVKGKILDKGPSHVVVDVAGVGLLLNTPISSFDRMGDVGEETELLTHLHVREDALDLYGFSEEAERRLFRMLLTVSGIGPRSALGILSGMNPEGLQTAILSGDVASLTRISGVGKKTAQRIVVELKGPLSDGTLEAGLATPGGRGDDKLGGAVEALVALGLRRSDAYRSVAEVLQTSDGDVSLEDVVRRVLSDSVKTAASEGAGKQKAEARK
jgi:Holliday junction DNA helicase RuvA